MICLLLLQSMQYKICLFVLVWWWQVACTQLQLPCLFISIFFIFPSFIQSFSLPYYIWKGFHHISNFCALLKILFIYLILLHTVFTLFNLILFNPFQLNFTFVFPLTHVLKVTTLSIWFRHLINFVSPPVSSVARDLQYLCNAPRPSLVNVLDFYEYFHFPPETQRSSGSLS